MAHPDFTRLRTIPKGPGGTLTACGEALEVRDAPREDAGPARFKHWGVQQEAKVVFEGERAVMIERRRHWRDR